MSKAFSSANRSIGQFLLFNARFRLKFTSRFSASAQIKDCFCALRIFAALHPRGCLCKKRENLMS
jgi:hypothetical protein